jgi:hypothetical protein
MKKGVVAGSLVWEGKVVAQALEEACSQGKLPLITLTEPDSVSLEVDVTALTDSAQAEIARYRLAGQSSDETPSQQAIQQQGRVHAHWEAASLASLERLTELACRGVDDLPADQVARLAHAMAPLG